MSAQFRDLDTDREEHKQKTIVLALFQEPGQTPNQNSIIYDRC